MLMLSLGRYDYEKLKADGLSLVSKSHNPGIWFAESPQGADNDPSTSDENERQQQTNEAQKYISDYINT